MATLQVDLLDLILHTVFRKNDILPPDIQLKGAQKSKSDTNATKKEKVGMI